jgi:DNA-binding transcriptional LysR family regulator
MLPFSELAVFAGVVEAGGFSAAAARLGLSKAAVSDHVRRLEARLGARLLNRTTRRIALTEAGEACYARARGMVAEADAAARTAEVLQAEPVGRLRITAPQTFGPLHVAPALAAFAALYPRLDLELLVTAQTVDLVRERLDVAIRIGSLPDSSLVARRIAMARMVIVAAPDYVRRRGALRAPAELAKHDTMQFTPLNWGEVWRLTDPGGRPRRLPIRPRFVTDSGDALVEAARAGLGLALVQDWMVHRHVAAGELIVQLPGWGRRNVPIHALHASQGRPAAKIRLFIDHLRRHLGDPAPWELTAG